MKNTYSDPKLQFITFQLAHVITASGDPDPAEDDLAWALEV
jgi:hypothetical protein